MRRSGYRELAHPADVALQVSGRDLSALYRNAASGLMHLLHCAPVAPLAEPPSLCISLHAPDLETLMVDWLGELLYLVERHQRGWTVHDVRVDQAGELTAVVRCSPCARPQREFKAVTFSGLCIVATAKGYETVIVLDA
jgi:SHS2 domain-containing protein